MALTSEVLLKFHGFFILTIRYRDHVYCLQLNILDSKHRKLIANTCEICDIHVNKEKITLLLSVLNSYPSVLEKSMGLYFKGKALTVRCLSISGYIDVF